MVQEVHESTYDLDLICLRNNLKMRHMKKDCIDEALKQKALHRLQVLKKNKKVVQRLLTVPKIEQKSEAWYLMRQNLITASDFAQALGQGKFGNQIDIIKKKVRPDKEGTSFSTNPFFRWGNMFEPVANDIYSKMHYNLKIHEFGLIPHPTLDFFGASPDGISDTGIMLEIKCPYKRKIERGGEVPKQYYYQIQGQLEVCGLQECDYFECQFQLFNTLDEFYSSYGDDKIKGVIIEKGNGYLYSPIVMGNNSEVTLEELRCWVDEHTNEEFVDIKLWYLQEYNLQRVSFDKQFVDEKLKELKLVWDKILFYRQNPLRYDVEVLRTITIDNDSGLVSSKQSKSAKNDTCDKKIMISGYSFIADPHE